MLAILVSGGEAGPRFEDTKAAEAFRAGRYMEALEELRKLAETNPDNPLVLRYLAMTLDNLGRHEDAIAIFEKAVELAPDSAAVHFHFAVSLYKARYGDLAAREFRRAEELAPGSRYAKVGRQFLDALAKQNAQHQRSGEPSSWGLYAQLGYQYDDNIAAAPDDGSFSGDKTGNRMVTYVAGSYRYLRTPEWTGSADVSGYRARYTDDAFDDSGVDQVDVSAVLQRNGALWGKSVSGTVQLGYTQVELENGGKYSDSYNLTLGTRFGFTPNTATNFYYSFTKDTFADKGFDPAISSRDADNHSIGITQTWYFNQRKWFLGLGYSFNDSKSEGLNFNSEAHSLRLSSQFKLPWKLSADLGVSYTDSKSGDFVGPVLKETENWGASAGLSRWFGSHFQARLTYSYHETKSTYSSLGYDRQAFGLTLTYAY